MNSTETEKTFGDGFDAGQNEALSYMGPMLDAWDAINPDDRAQIQAMAPLFVQHLNCLKQTMDRT